MKASQLRNIIKEEILKALSEYDPYEKGMERFKEKLPFKDPNPFVKNVMKYEKLPGYSELPELHKDIDFKNRKSILLPSSFDSNVKNELFSKEAVKEWYDEFVGKFKQAPQFKVENGKIKVVNADKPDFKGMKDFGGLD